MSYGETDFHSTVLQVVWEEGSSGQAGAGIYIEPDRNPVEVTKVVKHIRLVMIFYWWL